MMPLRDGTGPTGQGPVAGRGAGRGTGRGAGRGIGLGAGRRGLGGSTECECPSCGHKQPHARGIPCSQVKCPKCGTPMRGAFCK